MVDCCFGGHFHSVDWDLLALTEHWKKTPIWSVLTLFTLHDRGLHTARTASFHAARTALQLLECLVNRCVSAVRSCSHRTGSRLVTCHSRIRHLRPFSRWLRRAFHSCLRPQALRHSKRRCKTHPVRSKLRFPVSPERSESRKWSHRGAQWNLAMLNASSWTSSV